jgi:hypothetical protein
MNLGFWKLKLAQVPLNDFLWMDESDELLAGMTVTLKDSVSDFADFSCSKGGLRLLGVGDCDILNRPDRAMGEVIF